MTKKKGGFGENNKANASNTPVDNTLGASELVITNPTGNPFLGNGATPQSSSNSDVSEGRSSASENGSPKKRPDRDVPKAPDRMGEFLRNSPPKQTQAELDKLKPLQDKHEARKLAKLAQEVDAMGTDKPVVGMSKLFGEKADPLNDTLVLNNNNAGQHPQTPDTVILPRNEKGEAIVPQKDALQEQQTTPVRGNGTVAAEPPVNSSPVLGAGIPNLNLDDILTPEVVAQAKSDSGKGLSDSSEWETETSTDEDDRKTNNGASKMKEQGQGNSNVPQQPQTGLSDGGLDATLGQGAGFNQQQEGKLSSEYESSSQANSPRGLQSEGDDAAVREVLSRMEQKQGQTVTHNLSLHTPGDRDLTVEDGRKWGEWAKHDAELKQGSHHWECFEPRSGMGEFLAGVIESGVPLGKKGLTFDITNTDFEKNAAGLETFKAAYETLPADQKNMLAISTFTPNSVGQNQGRGGANPPIGRGQPGGRNDFEDSSDIGDDDSARNPRGRRQDVDDKKERNAAARGALAEGMIPSKGDIIMTAVGVGVCFIFPPVGIFLALAPFAKNLIRGISGAIQAKREASHSQSSHSESDRSQDDGEHGKDVKPLSKQKDLVEGFSKDIGGNRKAKAAFNQFLQDAGVVSSKQGKGMDESVREDFVEGALEAAKVANGGKSINLKNRADQKLLNKAAAELIADDHGKREAGEDQGYFHKSNVRFALESDKKGGDFTNHDRRMAKKEFRDEQRQEKKNDRIAHKAEKHERLLDRRVAAQDLIDDTKAGIKDAGKAVKEKLSDVKNGASDAITNRKARNQYMTQLRQDRKKPADENSQERGTGDGVAMLERPAYRSTAKQPNNGRDMSL